MSENTVTIAEAAQRLDCNEAYVRKLIAAGVLKPVGDSIDRLHFDHFMTAQRAGEAIGGPRVQS